MQARPVSFGHNVLKMPKTNKKPITYHIPKNYYVDTSVSKLTLGANKVYKFIKNAAKYVAESFK